MSELDRWLDGAKKYLIDEWQLSKEFSGQVALLMAYLFQYGLNPRVTSGFRSQEKQTELYNRWLKGEPGIYKPSKTVGQHGTKTMWQSPAAEAVDIATSNQALAAQIASALGIGAGYYYKNPDPVHFYRR